MTEEIQKTLDGIQRKAEQIHRLRARCKCGSMRGEIRPRGAQDCVYCYDCGVFQYNANAAILWRRCQP